MNDVLVKLNMYERRLRELRGQIEKIYGRNVLVFWQLARDNVELYGLRFYVREYYPDSYIVIACYDGEIVIKNGGFVNLTSISCAENLVKNFDKIKEYIHAVNEFSREIHYYKEILERAEELSRIYGKPEILEETWSKIIQELEQPKYY